MRELLIGMLVLFVITGCNPPKSSPPVHSDVALEKRPAGSGSWSLKQVEVACASAPCPSQVGLLMFVFPARKDYHEIRRCTAFLVDSDRIMSNGHCDYTNNATGYFITAANIDGGRQIRRITRVVTKWFTPDLIEKQSDSGRPDAAVYELESPIHKIPPLQLAKLSDPTYSRLDGYVVNSSAIDKYEIEKVSCVVRRHEAFFPYAVTESPDVIRAFECATKPGNSGAPFFAPGSNSVQAIGQATADIKNFSEKVRRDLKVFERHTSITATNVRCLSAPARSCMAADPRTSGSRFASFQRDTVGKLLSRKIEASVAEAFRYKVSSYFQLTGTDPNEFLFEIVYRPFCRTVDEVPQSAPFPSELVRLRFNEWGELSEPERVDMKLSMATITRTTQDSFRLKTNWFPGFGPLLKAGDHPRALWGSIFSIDIPQCSRYSLKDGINF